MGRRGGALGWVMRGLGARWVAAAECGRAGKDCRDDRDCCRGLVRVEERRRDLRRRQRRCRPAPASPPPVDPTANPTAPRE